MFYVFWDGNLQKNDGSINFFQIFFAESIFWNGFGNTVGTEK